MKISRHIRAMVQAAGLDLVAIAPTGSGHFKATVRTTCGREERVVFPCSPSDGRAQKNQMAFLRRIAAGRRAA
jgi:hypothetical protein